MMCRIKSPSHVVSRENLAVDGLMGEGSVLVSNEKGMASIFLKAMLICRKIFVLISLRQAAAKNRHLSLRNNSFVAQHVDIKEQVRFVIVDCSDGAVTGV